LLAILANSSHLSHQTAGRQHQERIHSAVSFDVWQLLVSDCTALHCTALHCTALHCTALHCVAASLLARIWLQSNFLSLPPSSLRRRLAGVRPNWIPLVTDCLLLLKADVPWWEVNTSQLIFTSWLYLTFPLCYFFRSEL
jgi:hypothetical protein